MRTLLALFIFGMSLNASAENIFRIEIGKDFKNYSNSDLQRRVWELERAVTQLQMRVFQLEGKPSGTPAPENWSCTISAMGEEFVGTGATKAVATSDAMDKCKKGKDAFFCKHPSCEQEK